VKHLKIFFSKNEISQFRKITKEGRKKIKIVNLELFERKTRVPCYNQELVKVLVGRESVRHYSAL